MAASRSGRRAGRARIGDLFLYDLILLLVVVGLLWAERELARSAAAEPPRPGATPTPTPTAATPTPTARPTAPVRVTEPPPPRPSPAADDGPRREVERVVAAARAAADAGRVDEALAALARADAALRATAAWTELAAPLLDSLAVKVAADDPWRAVLPDAQVLADAGDLARVEALVARGGDAPRLARERERARARAAAKAPGGFQIRGFTPDEVRVEGRRCTVEGALERVRLLEVREAVDALLAQAEATLGAGLPDKLVLKVLAEDADPTPAAPLQASTHLRADDAPGDVIARARLLAARATVGQAAPAATAGAREALVHALAGAELSGREERPRLTPLGEVWRRRALASATAEALVEAWSDGAAPELSFALGFAALWGGPAGEPVRRALAAAREGRSAPLAPEEARALLAALPEILETS